MADIILVAATLAFIAICVGYVQWCDRIIGPDDFGADRDQAPDTAGSAAPDVVGHGPGELTEVGA